MQFLGTRDGIEKAIIKANGVSVSTVEVEMSMGDLAKCSFKLPPEFAGAFSTYGEVVTVSVESKSANGTLFKGRILSTGFSNMTRDITYRVDLVHELGYLLDSSSTLFPGNMPGSAEDNEAYITAPLGEEVAGTGGGSTLVSLNLTSNFGDDLKKMLNNYIEHSADVSGTGMDKPTDYQQIQQALNKIQSLTGQIDSPKQVENGITEAINSILKGSSISTTFWNVLSSFLGGLDLAMVCKSDGGIILIPNYAGIKASGNNSISPEWIISFDQNSRYERTPKSIVVLVSDITPGEMTGNKNETRHCGQFTINGGPAGAAGVFCVEAPPYLRSMTQHDYISSSEGMKMLMDKYASVIGAREIGKLMLCNLSCPLCLDVFPGVPVSFEHLSSIKSFTGGKITAFNKKFDGYCNSIRHEVSSSGVPRTLFAFTNVTDGSFQKESKHPLWAGATIPSW